MSALIDSYKKEITKLKSRVAELETVMSCKKLGGEECIKCNLYVDKYEVYIERVEIEKDVISDKLKLIERAVEINYG